MELIIFDYENILYNSINKGNFFGYAVTNDSEYAISINTANDFPSALDSFANTRPDSSLEVRALSVSDFPKTPAIK